MCGWFLVHRYNSLPQRHQPFLCTCKYQDIWDVTDQNQYLSTFGQYSWSLNVAFLTPWWVIILCHLTNLNTDRFSQKKKKKQDKSQILFKHRAKQRPTVKFTTWMWSRWDSCVYIISLVPYLLPWNLRPLVQIRTQTLDWHYRGAKCKNRPICLTESLRPGLSVQLYEQAQPNCHHFTPVRDAYASPHIYCHLLPPFKRYTRTNTHVTYMSNIKPEDCVFIDHEYRQHLQIFDIMAMPGNCREGSKVM